MFIHLQFPLLSGQCIVTRLSECKPDEQETCVQLRQRLGHVKNTQSTEALWTRMPIVLLRNIIVCLCVVVLSDHYSIIAVKYSRKFSQYSEKTPTLPERLFKNVDGLCYETFSEFG